MSDVTAGAHTVGDIDDAPGPRRELDAVVIVAMDDEAEPFLAAATANGPVATFGRSAYRRLRLADRNVLLIRSGIGLVNATGAATFAISAATARLPLIISAGTAGGVGEEVDVGDVVIGSRYITIDADARAFGYVLGQVPGMPPEYTSAPVDVPEAGIRMPDGSPLTTHRGLIVSSDAFVDAERALSIRSLFPGALATDMESVGIAQTCFAHDVPFVSVRGISDLCGPAADADHLTHVDDASERSAEVTIALLHQLG